MYLVSGIFVASLINVSLYYHYCYISLDIGKAKRLSYDAYTFSFTTYTFNELFLHAMLLYFENNI